jgi:tetratricopeptide (TPR) repeat protein
MFSGELAAERRAQLVAHLDGCEECRAVCAALAPGESAVPVPSGGERYTLGEQIARGGMGRILRARDRVLGRDVALKLPHAQPGARERFAREIAILARLSHPSIVTVLDAGQLDPETPFFAMPFLAGRTLADEVATGRMGREALLTTLPAVSAIAYAHSVGIVHRDLKPTNLFIGSFGECTVLDWGIAIALGEEAPNRSGWSEGYASPEQRKGEPPRFDHDVYALGAVLRFVMRGTHNAGPEDKAIPAELRSIITRATAPSGTRYATATELLADIQRYLSQGRVRAHRYTYREHMARWLRRHRTAAVALATATLAAGAIGAWSVSRIIAERDRAVAAERSSRAARVRTLELTNFLLDQVNRSVAELGRLDLATNLVTGLERHVATAPVSGPDGEAEVVQQIELRGLMTDIALAQGDFDQAQHHLAPVESALAQLPSTTAQTAYLRCEMLMRMADVRRGKGDPAGARAALQQCLASIAKAPSEVSEQDPRFDTVHTTAEAYVALGDLERDEGQSDAALGAYRSASALFTGPQPDDNRVVVARLVLQAAIEQRIGSISQFAQRWTDAADHFRAALAHAEAAVARRENEASAQWLVAQVQLALAVAVGESGDREQKRALVEKADRIAEPLFAIDPTNDEHARWMTILWRAKAELGPATEAPALFERILEVSRRRAQLQPRSVVTLRELAVDLTANATWLVESDDRQNHARAGAVCAEAVAVMQQKQKLLAAGTVDSDVALTLLHCAEVSSAIGDRALAQKQRQAAMDESRANASRTDTVMLAAYSTGLAAYLTDAPAAERRAGQAEMDRIWAELRAAKADDLMANMRDIAPWWQPKEN